METISKKRKNQIKTTPISSGMQQQILIDDTKGKQPGGPD